MILEDYVNDIIYKSINGEEHVVILRNIFEQIKIYNMWLNPCKCVFVVDTRNLMGFINLSHSI